LGKIGKIELKIGIENWGKLGRWFKCNLTLKKGRSSISFKNTLLRLPDTIILDREKRSIRNLNKMQIELENDEFANVTGKIFDYLEEKKAALIPSFFFIDPFGFTGIPFDIVKRILSNPKTEIFFTFMVRDIARFIECTTLKQTFTRLFAANEWKKIMELPDREKALIELYRKHLHDLAKVKYSLHFKVSESERFRTVYYLIHATNHIKGHSIMKQIMYREGPHGSFAYLGPIDLAERHQARPFDIHDTRQLKKLLLDRFRGQTLTYDEIQEEMCSPWHSEPPYINTHYNQALKELEKEQKIKIVRITSKTTRGLSGNDLITFLKNIPDQITLSPTLETYPHAQKNKIFYKEYALLNGMRKNLVYKVNDGSIISRFDKTPLPVKETDIVCPHFLELKWAYGCPYDCAWCYLKGTFRFRPEGTSPVIKPYDKIRLHTERFLEEVKEPEILNTGEIADSLMNEDSESPFSKLIIPLFEKQAHHRVLFLTKSYKIKNLLEIEPHRQTIISFSLNSIPVAETWERAPHILKRIEAARKVIEAGYEVRLRIDPMVPIEHWEKT
jgi:hypothetical protein